MKINDIIHQEPPSVQAELADFFKNFPKEAEVFIKEVPAGSYVIREDTPSLNVYIILDGKVTPKYYSGHNAFVAGHYGRLSVMGDIAALGRFESYNTSIRTLTKCRLLEVRISDYWNWILQDHAFLKKQLENAFGLLIKELKVKRVLEEESADVRLLSYFIFYYKREKFNKGNSSRSITVKETRERIAEEVGGISIRTVNRKISQFVEEGLITVVHGKVQISLEQLRKMQTIIGGQDEEENY